MSRGECNGRLGLLAREDIWMLATELQMQIVQVLRGKSRAMVRMLRESRLLDRIIEPIAGITQAWQDQPIVS